MSKKYLLLLISLVFSFALLFPGSSKAVVDHVVISQVQITGATATDEFVELFNPTANPVDLTGFRLTKKVTGSGTQSTLVATLSGTVAPNGYFLIKHPTGYTGSAVADTQYSTASSITASNTVLLYSDAGTTIVDKVGFGTPFESETSPFSTNPTAGQSIRRINNQDTDNNSIDFELLATSSPRNSSFVQATLVPTSSPVPTSVPTLVPSMTATPTVLPTLVPTPAPTDLPTSTPSPTPVETLTPTDTPTPTLTPTPMETSEPTETPTPALTPTPSPVASPTVVATPTLTPKPDKDHDHHFGHKIHDFINSCGRFIHDSFEKLHEDSHNNSKKWPSINNFGHYSKKHF